MRISNLFLFIGIITLPLYVLPSGSVQLSHAMLMLFFLSVIFFYSIRLDQGDLVLLFLFLIVLVRELFSILWGAPVTDIKQPIFLLFNTLIFLSIKNYLSNGREGFYFYYAFLLSISIAVVLLVIFGFSLTGLAVVDRAVGSFNNPNQLGYYSVCMISIISLFLITDNIPKIIAIIAYACCIFLTLASLSKAALIGAGLSCAFMSFAVFHKTSQRFISLFVLALAGAYYYARVNLENVLFVQRLSAIGQDSDDSFESRGYFALFSEANSVFEYIFGLGYNGSLEALGHEIHSTYAYFLGNYGILGGAGFIYFLFLWVIMLYTRFGLLTSAAIFGPPMIYGIAHTGVRFTAFYVLIALSYSLCNRRNDRV